MPTLELNEDFESGSLAAYGSNGSPTIVTTDAHSGTHSVEINAANEWVTYTPSPANPTLTVGRCWFKLISMPAAAQTNVIAAVHTAAGKLCAFRVNTSGVFQVIWTSGAASTFAGTGLTLTTGQWYRLDYEADVSANPHTATCKIWDGTTTYTLPSAATGAFAASTIDQDRLGNTNGVSCDILVDDWAISRVAGDYPIGDIATTTSVEIDVTSGTAITTKKKVTKSAFAVSAGSTSSLTKQTRKKMPTVTLATNIALTKRVGKILDTTFGFIQGTQINEGDNIEGIIEAGAVDEVFAINPGEYRLTGVITPKAGQRILGAGAGVVKLNASKLLTGWTGTGPYTWNGGALPGPTLNGTLPPTMLYPQNRWQEQVFMDGLPLWCCGSKSGGTTYGSTTPAAGEYYIDFDADTITLHDDPSGHTLEISQPNAVFSSSNDNIEIAGLHVYGSSDRGIRANSAANDWEIHDCEVSGNFVGIGIPGAPIHVSHCDIHHNGQQGMNGSGDGQTVEYNDIHDNNTLKLFDSSGGTYAAGGVKFTTVDGMSFSYNRVYSNWGDGIWFDIDCINITIEGNEAHDNTECGIHYEISYRATIRNNLVYNNGDKGLWLSTSQDTTVDGNKFYDNTAWNLLITDQVRTEAATYGPLRGINNTIQNNEFFNNANPDVGGQEFYGDNECFTTNTWTNNTHHNPSSATTLYRWNGSSLNAAGWQAAGNDTAGTITNDEATATRPSATLTAPALGDQRLGGGGYVLTLQQLVGKNLIVTAGSAVSRITARLMNIAVSAGSSVTLGKRAQKPITVSAGSTRSINKAASKTLSLTGGTSAVLQKLMPRTISITAPSTVSLAKSFAITIATTASKLVTLDVSGPAPLVYVVEIAVSAGSTVSSVVENFFLHTAVLFATESPTSTLKKAITKTLSVTAHPVLNLLRGIVYTQPDPENNIFVETGDNSVGVIQGENTITITEG